MVGIGEPNLGHPTLCFNKVLKNATHVSPFGTAWPARVGPVSNQESAC